jgi:hypothetical protein
MERERFQKRLSPLLDRIIVKKQHPLWHDARFQIMQQHIQRKQTELLFHDINRRLEYFRFKDRALDLLERFQQFVPAPRLNKESVRPVLQRLMPIIFQKVELSG